jgi:uncharacterized Zn finger protein
MPEASGAIEETVEASSTARLRSVSLPCENCGRTTSHRVLRWDPRGKRATVPLSGIARCQECRWTHPFTQPTTPVVEIALVVSEGEKSRRERVQVPAHRRLQVGSRLPGGTGAFLIHRIDTRSRESVTHSTTDDVATVWVTPEGETAVAVSIVERAQTRPVRWVVPTPTEVAVGDELRVDGTDVVVVALRARGHTWRLFGDRFVASDIQRVYARRREMPPAGSSDWSRVRVRPSSRESSTSIASRSRSSPGTRTARTAPRD